ncbi:hypothetical protein [Oricola indica]|uniref:hypothetical protein n=1 Tax=Oricola indica TaxID=2872591 RepID=UPI003CCBC54B
MIKAPRHDGDWPDRALECEEAMEDAFLDVFDRLQVAGMTPEQAAGELIEAAANPDHPFAHDLRQIAAWAKQAGWRATEVGNGIVSLAENNRRSVEANRETERQIRLAWERPN